MNNLDSFDHRLLELLQVDSRQTGKQLSEKVGLSAAACLRRVQRLRQTGVIERDVAVVSADFLAPSVKIIVLLTFLRDQPDRVDALRKRLMKLPQVKQLHHVTGEADFLLHVQCGSMEDYAAFTEAHFYAPYIKRFDSLVVLRAFTASDG